VDNSARCEYDSGVTRINYQQLARLPAMRKFYRLIRRLFRVNVAMTGPEWTGGVQMGSARAIAPFCSAVQQLPRLRRACLECDRRHVELVSARRRASRYRCHAGLTEFLVPIVLDNEIVAFLQSGQILDAPPTERTWRRTRAGLKLSGGEADKLKPLYLRVQTIAPAAQTNLITLLEFFGNHIAYTQSQLLLLGQPWNSQLVVHARRYMRERLAERVVLDDVARAAFTSKRNLTRVFLTETGMTVLGFLQRSRIDRACRQLLSSGETCAKIAYDSGFGSVQQFNRVFRQLKKSTPSAWRRGKKTTS
jgi:AraC-like DNA-binding protein